MINDSYTEIEKENIKDEIKKMLSYVGYEVVDDDDYLIEHTLGKVDNYILNITHQSEVPKTLKYVRIYRVVGEILYGKVMFNKIDEEKLQIEPMITEMYRGDTKTTFEKPNVSNKELLLKYLKFAYTDYGENEIIQYRVLVW